MYNDFFQFKERPFQLVPNPDYFFLSRSHEEALAHLNYALSHGDGFVEITGEVGTGKTTLCRAFLEGLGDDCEVAYIFNPRLNSIDLLRTIIDEFAIPLDEYADNTKNLMDRLNQFLIEKKSQKKNPILLVDEAQNLDHDVLEQLRLLSNLETNTSKLLQIILVGQPELRKMLDSYNLRQFRQRLTLSWYLTPLSSSETSQYIRHRIKIASKKNDEIFSRSACRRIYNYSGGIPRLINIACDRALLTAYGFSSGKVTGSIASNSIKELKARGGHAPALPNLWKIPSIAIAVIALIVTSIFIINALNTGDTGGVTADDTGRLPANTNTTINTPRRPHKTPEAAKKFTRLENFLAALESRSSRLHAIQNVLSAWKITATANAYLGNIQNDGDFFRLIAFRNHFQVHEIKSEPNIVKQLNLPAVLEFNSPGASTRTRVYLMLVKFDDDLITLKGGKSNQTITIKPDEFQARWTGNAFILWKNFLEYKGDIPLDASQESILTLKVLLRDIGFNTIKADGHYDDLTIEAVKTVQKRHGLKVDGIVGARTKIVIYNEKQDLEIPHICSSRELSH